MGGLDSRLETTTGDISAKGYHSLYACRRPGNVVWLFDGSDIEEKANTPT
jgi:hypothetical protein